MSTFLSKICDSATDFEQKVRDDASYEELRKHFDKFVEEAKDLYIRLDDRGNYYQSYYMDRGEGSSLAERLLSYISTAGNLNKDELLMYAQELYEDVESDMTMQVVDAFGRYLEANDIDVDEDSVRDLVYDVFYVDLKEVVSTVLSLGLDVDIVLTNTNTNNEAQHGFVHNSDFGEDDKFSQLSSSWPFILKSQGIEGADSVEDLRGIEGKVASSIVEEIENTTSDMNAFTFFVKMGMEDFLKLQEGNYSSITLKAGTPCGLVDFWYGAGSLLEVDLDKPVTLPKGTFNAVIDKANPYGYSVAEIYGMLSSFWKSNAVKINE